MTTTSVLVVGASLGGLTVVEALRREGFSGSVTLLGAERHLPYDRPPLSKRVLLSAMEPSQTQLRPQSTLDQLHAELVLSDPAVCLDASRHEVKTASGRVLAADVIVLATGLVPRKLSGQDGLSGVYVLRTLDDALALKSALVPGKKLVVVGDGVLGTEIAATACSLGLAVTLVGPQSLPMRSQLGPLVGSCLGTLHSLRGVNLRLGTGVASLRSDSSVVTESVCKAEKSCPPIWWWWRWARFQRRTGWLEVGFRSRTEWSVIPGCARPQTSMRWVMSRAFRTKSSDRLCGWKIAPMPSSKGSV